MQENETNPVLIIKKVEQREIHPTVSNDKKKTEKILMKYMTGMQ